MFLHEEYLARHNINLPFVVHGKDSSLILKNPSLPSSWRVFKVSFTRSYPTGVYRIAYLGFRHNGYRDKKYLDVLFESPKVHYDQLESYLLSTVKIIDFSGFKPVLNFNESMIFLWESFLYTHDAWIASRFKKDFLNLVVGTLDFDKSTKERIFLIHKAWNILSKQPDNTLRSFDNNFKNFIDDKSGWLNNLIKSKTVGQHVFSL